MTDYVILHKVEKGWYPMEKPVTASSARSAISKALNGAQAGGEFCAIPARSWRPVKVQVETALKFS